MPSNVDGLRVIMTHGNLTDKINADERTYEEFAKCEICGSGNLVRLADDWFDRDSVIPIVACGNPFHYATRSLADSPDAI